MMPDLLVDPADIGKANPRASVREAAVMREIADATITLRSGNMIRGSSDRGFQQHNQAPV